MFKAEGLCKSFGALEVARGISLALPRGARHAIVGPNGSGKTTLFNLLSGELATYRGKHFQLDHARLFDRPASKPDVVLAAGGPKAAALAGEKADGLIVTEARKDIVEAYGARGRSGSRYAEVALCCCSLTVFIFDPWFRVLVGNPP